MSDLSVQIPPIRTNLNDPSGTDQTAKEWYLFWSSSADRINVFNGMIAYGSHGARLDPADAQDGALYIEEDRGSVLYEMQGNVWQYVAGTMWDTLNPDNRPKDLGIHDPGFTFRTIDTDPQYAGRTFVWSGTVWVETTSVRFDTHAHRTAGTVENENGMLWVETDRGNVLYQLQGTTWNFVAGIMWGTIAPDQRPTDLAGPDIGFQYRGTDQPRQFIWNGTAWIETTPAIAAQSATSTGSNLVLTTANQDIPGATITLARAGLYQISAVFCFYYGESPTLQNVMGIIVCDGVQTGKLAEFSGGAAGELASIPTMCLYQAPAIGKVVKLQASKSGGTGTTQAVNSGFFGSTITAVWISP